MSPTSIRALNLPLEAVAFEARWCSPHVSGFGRPVVVAMTPEAVLASLDGMRFAAAAAILQQEEAAAAIT